MRKALRTAAVLISVLFVAGAVVRLASALPHAVTAAPTTLSDFTMPGSQPNDSGTLQALNKCDACHGGYDEAVEPVFNWRGSMMSQAARDPLFYACLAVANQDAPESGDLCIRCHSPKGWLEGRSSPTDGSALTSADRQGVQCDFCHRAVKPTPLGVNPYPADSAYTAGTYPADQTYLGTLAAIPPTSADGMYVVDSDGTTKRGPFTDAGAPHPFYYSPFHEDKFFCGTCHDVSNPVFNRTGDYDYTPNTFGQPPPSADPYQLFPIERTYSEWSMSAYNQPGGVYAPQFGGNRAYVSTCQDCHMKDVTGVACNKSTGVLRDSLPLHDQTGGNTFIPKLVAQLYPSDVDTSALSAGIQRATGMLEKAATLSLDVTPDGTSGYTAHVRVTNDTAHKLPSGYPEGRRMWINLKALDAQNNLIYESGAYDPSTGVLTHDTDAKIYEIEAGLSPALAAALGLPAGPGFHFVLNDTIYKDNRIPPIGFTNAAFTSIQSPPVGYSYADGQSWDDTYYSVPYQTAHVVATLYYQTTSKEFVEFLRDQNSTNTAGQTMYDLWAANGKSPPVPMATQTYDINLTAAEGTPGAVRLSVRGLPSSPADAPQVEFALPSAGPARLELFDVHGRRILVRQVGSMGAGDHRAQLHPARRLASGVYLIRLVQGRGSATAKLVLAR
jgi:hypothetical protein